MWSILRQRSFCAFYELTFLSGILIFLFSTTGVWIAPLKKYYWWDGRVGVWQEMKTSKTSLARWCNWLRKLFRLCISRLRDVVNAARFRRRSCSAGSRGSSRRREGDVSQLETTALCIRSIVVEQFDCTKFHMIYGFHSTYRRTLACLFHWAKPIVITIRAVKKV